jgi:hypothetical protein
MSDPPVEGVNYEAIGDAAVQPAKKGCERSKPFLSAKPAEYALLGCSSMGASRRGLGWLGYTKSQALGARRHPRGQFFVWRSATTSGDASL